MFAYVKKKSQLRNWVSTGHKKEDFIESPFMLLILTM